MMIESTDRLSRRALVTRAAAAVEGLLAVEALRSDPADAARWPAASAYGAEVPAAWFEFALTLVRTTPGFSPPVASRAFAYAGVAMHEALVPGLSDRGSLAGRLSELTPAPGAPDQTYHWPTVANSALATILRSLFPTGDLAAIAALDQQLDAQARAVLPQGIHRRSVSRGAAIAGHVFAWSRTDGGHEAFRNNFPAYTPPTGLGLWEPTPPAFAGALQPNWGENRPFVFRSVDACSPDPPPPFSEDAASAFHAEAFECYRAVAELTPEQKAIARFWSDDPGQTATPPGHSISILNQTVRALDLPLDRAAEAYAKVGVAFADAFISCWRTKYRFNLLRPVTYIRKRIDASWTPLLVTPPFPEYTSGHSVQSAAAAEVLTDLFGNRSFTDRTHETRGLPARSFPSFTAAAEEAAVSRLYGGIHFRAGIERGLEQGACVGARASAL
jgi:hypothetical protein